MGGAVKRNKSYFHFFNELKGRGTAGEKAELWMN